MSSQKKVLTKLMRLDNKQADKFLAHFALKIKKQIMIAGDNDIIIEQLGLLEEFVYKVPKETIAIGKYIIGHPQKTKLIKSNMGNYYGFNHEAVISKFIELLDRIRYIHPSGVLPLLFQLSNYENDAIKNKALETVKHFSKFDINVLTSNIGYGAQRKSLDYIIAIPTKKQLSNLDFIITGIKELLGSSAEGTSAATPMQLTLQFGSVDPNLFLKKLRREAIDFIIGLYAKVSDDKDRIKLLKVLQEVSRTPTHVKYSDKLAKMIASDIKYLLAFYRKILFSSKAKLTAPPAITNEIYERLYWFNKTDFLKSSESTKLRDDILSDEFYQLFTSIVGDRFTYREDMSYEESELKRQQVINDIIEQITDTTLTEWQENLNKIAGQFDLIDEWQFIYFNGLLNKLSQQKSDLAFTILLNAFTNKKPLKNLIFVPSFLSGFRSINRFDYWDQIIALIIQEKNIPLTSTIFYSFDFNRDLGTEDVIREEDFTLLSNVINHTGGFEHTNNHKELSLTFSIVSALVKAYNTDKTRIESLLIQEIRNTPWAKESHIRTLVTALHRGQIDYGNFSEDSINFFKGWLITFDDLGWEAQTFLQNIGKADIKIILDVFIKRIENDPEENKKRRGDLIKSISYNCIPYHFNPELKERIAKDPAYIKYVREWLTNVTPVWSPYNWHIGQFFGKVGSPSEQIIFSLIEKGDDVSLRKATYLIDQFSGVDENLCFEIVKKTDDPKILGTIEAILGSTGVVSGEYGLAESYESKAEKFKKYIESPDKRVNKFATRLVKNFKAGAEHERKRTDEDIELRRIEFEG